MIVGFLGGYTTFSSYVYESLNLIERGEFLLAGVYLGGSAAVGLVAVTLGVVVGRLLGVLW